MASPFIEIPVGDRLVKVTNPDKVYFPEHGYTKRQLVEYYIAVGEGILRATRDRPTTLERWPAGERRSRLVFIVRDLRQADIERSLAVFQRALGRTPQALLPA